MTDSSALGVAEDFLEEMVASSRAVAARQFVADDADIRINDALYTRSEYLDRLETSDNRFEVLDVTIRERLLADNSAALACDILVEHSGVAFGVEPEHDNFSESVGSFFRIEDGTIVELDITHDPTATLEALGLLSADPTTEKVRDQYYEILNRVLRHDLRNKLNVILASAETVEDDPSGAATSIKEKTADLLSTVEKAQKIEQMAIDVPLEPVRFPVADAVSGVLSQYERHHGVSCHCTCSDQSLELNTDRRLFQNILEETVQNAILYSDAETPEVTVTARPASRDGYSVELEVEDNGPGIPESELEPLRQDQETQLLHGSGIGLWITKWCVTRLDGQMMFGDRSAPTVRIVLPSLSR